MRQDRQKPQTGRALGTDNDIWSSDHVWSPQETSPNRERQQNKAPFGEGEGSHGAAEPNRGCGSGGAAHRAATSPPIYELRLAALTLVIALVVVVVVITPAVADAPIAVPLVPVIEMLVPRAVPIAFIVHATLITGAHPGGTLIGRPSPIPLMPAVPVSLGIPITVHPDVAGARRSWPHAYYARSRWLTEADPEGDLPEHRTRGQ
jgi:hypothetical protein